MIKMNAATSKNKSNGRDEQPLDTSSMKPVNADATEKPKDIASVASVASASNVVS
jgi:hypothetical protein